VIVHLKTPDFAAPGALDCHLTFRDPVRVSSVMSLGEVVSTRKYLKGITLGITESCRERAEQANPAVLDPVPPFVMQ